MKGAAQIVEFLFEAGELKRVKRSGWWTAKIRDPESVAEHSFRTGLTAYLLAMMEGEDDAGAARTAVAALAHDLHEARTLDLHKISARYFDKHAGEGRARKQQGFESALRLTARQQAIVKDADLLEMAMQAKEYSDAGNAHAPRWLKAAGKGVRTAGGRRLFREISRTDSAGWWKRKGRRADVAGTARGLAPARAKEAGKAVRRPKTARGGRKGGLPYNYWRWGRFSAKKPRG
ncbi:MAG: HD domain-containing protein [Candidatus Micrarchaeota archaeon]